MTKRPYVFVVIETDRDQKYPQTLYVFKNVQDANEYCMNMAEANKDRMFHVQMSQLR